MHSVGAAAAPQSSVGLCLASLPLTEVGDVFVFLLEGCVHSQAGLFVQLSFSNTFSLAKLDP